MGRGGGTRKSRKGKRWRIAIVLLLLLVTLGAGAWATRGKWRRGPDKDPLRLQLLYQAWSEFDAKQYDSAAATLDRRLSEVATTPLDWMLRARIAEAQGRLGEALEKLKEIPDSDVIGARARLKAGQIEKARGHAIAAEAAYRRSLALDPSLIQTRRELAYLYAVQLRYDACDAEFRGLARLMPLDYILAFAWCQNFCHIWDPYEAQKALTWFVTEDPSDRWSRLALATSYRLTNNPEEAEAVLRPLPDSDPDALAIRIRVALDRGAIDIAEELARHGPEAHPELDVLRGEFALHRGDPKRAVSYFRSVLGSNPFDRDALQGLSLALKRLGDPAAREFADRAASIDRLKRTIIDSVSTIRTDPQLFCRLGEMCEDVNRADEARTWYQLAISRDVLDTRAHQALARLEKKISEGGAVTVPQNEKAN